MPDQPPIPPVEHDEATVQRCIDAVLNDDGLSVRLYRSEVERIVRTVLAASRQMDPPAPQVHVEGEMCDCARCLTGGS